LEAEKKKSHHESARHEGMYLGVATELKNFVEWWDLFPTYLEMF